MRLQRQLSSPDHADDVGTSAPRHLHVVPEDPALKAERRMRDAGGPRDHALYRCGCGYVFEAAVTTTVECPHCSGIQAW